MIVNETTKKQSFLKTIVFKTTVFEKRFLSKTIVSFFVFSSSFSKRINRLNKMKMIHPTKRPFLWNKFILEIRENLYHSDIFWITISTFCLFNLELFQAIIQLSPKWAIHQKNLSNFVLTIFQPNNHLIKKINICNIPFTESEEYDIWWTFSMYGLFRV